MRKRVKECTSDNFMSINKVELNGSSVEANTLDCMYIPGTETALEL